ncbi:hypothetical protein KCP73_21675 [Salmonella enterica subsp. enterica]|nr:hypothetical protein KCP73_21675 [Salmonella enterica subsp. enterica]
MGGYAFCLAGGGDDRMPLCCWRCTSVPQPTFCAAWRKQRAREARMRAAQATGGGVNLRRKTAGGWSARCWRAWG